jgi:hypothetical protein
MHIIFRLIALIMMLVLMQPAIATAGADGSVAQKSSDARFSRLPPAYPNWPEREMQMNVVPAPPLGPYLSTGLSSSGPRFACCDRVIGEQESAYPFKDIPWPARRIPPRQWIPEGGGYNYAPGDAVDTTASEPLGGYRGQGMPQPTWQPMYQRPPQVRYR